MARKHATVSGMSNDVPRELLLPDPDLMGSPEGDARGLRELQEAARARLAAADSVTSTPTEPTIKDG
jgi:hypothetical protein